MNIIIQIDNFSKSYGNLKAVNGISLSIPKGEMFGLVGPDGAGKTTTIRALCGLLKSDSGNISLMDFDIKKNRKDIQNNIGYLSQKFSLYEDLTIDENIEFFAEIHNIKKYEERRNELLEFTRLTEFRKRQAGRLSGGMKQKLALACSLIHKPKILFLDEPTTGVDPVSRRDFWKILSNLLKDGITIFMTTPYLDEAERCNRVALMNKGEIITLDTPAKIKESINKKVIEIVCDDVRLAGKLIKEKLDLDVQLFGDRLNTVVSNAESEFKRIEKLLTENNISINDYRINIPSLENVFIHLVKSSETN
ncbi:MAG: ABC transporter ATP-binding protein [Ignavibacteriales bacterium]|nr:ABC transporter ATP-binding protein [Ignavibacteriota bacterium]MCB9249908.1 ABC transporter ATP-binding protein [Ignavibacteriales bacterium]